MLLAVSFVVKSDNLFTCKNHKTGKTYTGYIHPKYEDFLLKRCNDLKINDYIGEYQLTEVNTQSVVLRSGSQRIELNVFVNKEFMIF